MEPTPSPLDQQDAYLLGHMSEQEQRDFAARAAQDPVQAQELRLQQDILEGLRRTRTAQLKARLNQLPTPPAASLGTAQWLGISAATVAVVAGGITLLLTQRPDAGQIHQDSIRIEAQRYTPNTAEAQPAPAASKAHGQTAPAANAEAANATDGALTEARTEPNLTPPMPKGAGEQIAPATSAPSSVKSKAVATGNEPYSASPLNPAQPDEEAEENGTIDRPGLGKISTGKVVEDNEVKTKPEVVIGESEVLSYQYFENRLFLYGSFGDAIYELIELVSAKEGRRLFVYYKGSFYKVEKNVREITPMSPVDDPRLEAELTLLRKKRAD